MNISLKILPIILVTENELILHQFDEYYILRLVRDLTMYNKI